MGELPSLLEKLDNSSKAWTGLKGRIQSAQHWFLTGNPVLILSSLAVAL